MMITVIIIMLNKDKWKTNTQHYCNNDQKAVIHISRQQRKQELNGIIKTMIIITVTIVIRSPYNNCKIKTTKKKLSYKG